MDQIEICVGTYENLILGYRIQEKTGGGFTLESSFTTDSHRGALRCMAVSPQGVLASTSTDDSIRLHSLKKRREVGSLFQHDGSVNCIRFFTGGHMFSASEDGTICLWKCKNWELMRLLKGHKSHVLAVAVHPSAKLGLSVGNDRSFFTWDLTTGKLAFKRKIEQVAQDILFTKEGNNYILIYQTKIEVCSLEDTMVVQEINLDSRINCVCSIEEDILAVGGNDGKVYIINVMSGETLIQETFKGRVRSVSNLSTKTGNLLFIAGSNGTIRVYRLDLTQGSEKMETVVSYDSGVRITCMIPYGSKEILREEVQNGSVKDKRRRKRKMWDREDDNESNHDEDVNHDDVKEQVNDLEEEEDNDEQDEEDNDEEEEVDSDEEEEEVNDEEEEEVDDEEEEDSDEEVDSDEEEEVDNDEEDDDQHDEKEDEEEENDEDEEAEEPDVAQSDSDSEVEQPKKKKKKNNPKKLQEKVKIAKQQVKAQKLKKQKSKSEELPQPKKKRKVT